MTVGIGVSLVGGSAVLAAQSSDELSGVIAVSTEGTTRSLGVQTYAAEAPVAPVVDIALAPSGTGYVTLDRFGATRSYGTAPTLGRATPPKKGVVAVALDLTPDGSGAVVAFSDGTVATLGGAPSALASTVASGGSSPVVDVALSPAGAGGWLLRRDGTTVALGAAARLGRAPASDARATGIALTPTAQGAWVAREDGSVAALGDAEGERGPREGTEPKVVGIAALGVLDDWVLVDVEGNLERRGESPRPLPGKGAGIVAVDTLAASLAVTQAGLDAYATTKLVAPGAVLGTSGNPAGELVVTLPCFVAEGPSPLQAGDVIAASIGEHTPDGLLRRVLEIGECAGGTVAVTTEIATLSDALPKGELDFSDDLSDLQVPDFTPTSPDGSGSIAPVLASASPFTTLGTTESGAQQRQASSASAAAGAVGTVAEEGRFTYGCPSDPDDEDPSLKATPIFSFNPDVIFEGEWDGEEVHLRTGISLQGEIGVQFSANKGLSCDATFALIDDYSLGTKVIFVGPIPVVVEPQLTLEAKLEGTVGGELTTTASATGTATGALVVDVDSTPTYDLESSFTADGDLDWDLEAKAELGFSLSPSIGFLLYGVVAPTVELESGLTATLDPCESPKLKLEQPVTLTAKLEPAEWLSDELDVFENLDLEVANEFELPGSPFLLLSGDLAVPLPCDEDATTLPEGQVGVPYTTTLDVELPDGATGSAYGVSDGSELPAGLSLDTDGTLSGTPLASGIHAFSVDVRHSLGVTTAAFEITIREAAELEILTTFLPGATLRVPYSFTMQANRPTEELFWTKKSGALPDGITLDPDGTLAGTPTETGYFPFTVSVEHPDSGQTAEKILGLAVNAERIVFTSYRDGNGEIYVMNADGSGQTRLTNNTALDLEPSFSADGTKIAFTSYRDGNGEIYVMNADGSGQTRLTNNTAEDNQPSFSADGTKIAFTSRRDGNSGIYREIYVMNADGSGQTRLTSNADEDSQPSFGADGTKIAFTSYRDGNGGEIYVMNADGSDQTRLTNDTAEDIQPSLSADGTKIAFASYRDGTALEIYVMTADGSGQTRLTNNTATDNQPSFSADGTKIAFISNRDLNFEIYVMNADGTAQTRLTNHSQGDSDPSISR